MAADESSPAAPGDHRRRPTTDLAAQEGCICVPQRTASESWLGIDGQGPLRLPVRSAEIGTPKTIIVKPNGRTIMLSRNRRHPTLRCPPHRLPPKGMSCPTIFTGREPL